MSLVNTSIDIHAANEQLNLGNWIFFCSNNLKQALSKVAVQNTTMSTTFILNKDPESQPVR